MHFTFDTYTFFLRHLLINKRLNCLWLLLCFLGMMMSLPYPAQGINSAKLPYATAPFSDDDRQPGLIRGVITDQQTGETLIGVNILLEGTTTGTSSAADGSYRLEALPPGIYALRFSYVGYETFVRTDVIVRPGRATQLDISLQESAFDAEAITVQAGYFQRRNDQPVSSVSFNPEEIRRAPGGGQEVLRIVALLPSVASVGDTRQDILVRGGSVLENTYIVDNIPMPGIQHFRQQGGQSNGPIGIINTDLVADLSFQGGAFGASYGEALSSVTNITYREGSRNGLEGDVNFNMAGAGGTLEHGLAEGRGSLLLSARRSYLDLIADAINAGGAPRYSDAQLKAVYDLNDANRLSLINIYGSSQFRSRAGDAIDAGLDEIASVRNWQNTLGANLRTLWGTGFFTNTSLSWSVTGDETRTFRLREAEAGDLFLEDPEFALNAEAQLFALRSVSYRQLGRRAGIEFGTDVRHERTQFDYTLAQGFDRAGNVVPAFRRDTAVNGTLAAGFATLQLRPLSRLSVNAGLRADYTSYNSRTDWSPRASLRYALSSRWSASAGWGLYHQANPRFLLSQSGTNRTLANPRAMHWVAGLAYQITPETLITLEGYYKGYSRMPQLPGTTQNGDPGFVFDRAGSWLPELVSEGKGYARGVELLLQKKMADGFYGAVSASFFRTRYQDYRGNWQDRDFDIRYLFSVNGGWRPNNNYELSVRWSLQGGGPRTPFDETASATLGSGVLDMSRFNELRRPAFHALYVRADRRYFFRSTNLVTFIEIWNAYNRSNPDSYAWSSITNQETRINQFSILPVGGVSFEF